MLHGTPYATDGITPRNIETQCENIDVENLSTAELAEFYGLNRKYFGLDVRTSDPLLNVVKWIAIFTEVPCFDMRDVIVTSFFTDWCNYPCGCAFHPLSRFCLHYYWQHLPHTGGTKELDLFCLGNLLGNASLDLWPDASIYGLIYMGQTVKKPTSWDPTGKHFSGILKEKFENNRSES